MKQGDALFPTSLFAALLQRDVIKTLTLTQPWATLMACRAKQIETRCWSTTYRGPLAIHAARNFPGQAQALCHQEPFWSALRSDGYDVRLPPDKNLPLGKIVAIGMLEDVEWISFDFPVKEPERSFGNYGKRRYAWSFSTIYRLTSPIAARGSLGLWNWQPPESFWQEIQTKLEQERAAQ